MHTHDHAGDGHAEHAGHCHAAMPSTPQQRRSLRIALVLVSCFSAVELWVSLHSNSLSLLADAGHMIADVFAIALALWAAALTAQPDRTDADRLNAMAAFANGVLLLLVSCWLGWESIETLRLPSPEILSRPVAITAAVGLVVNGLNAYLLHAHMDDNLNLRGAFLHMVADAGSCLGVLIGALLIARYGWYWADGVVGGAIALLIFSSALPLIRRSLAILQSSPLNQQLASPLNQQLEQPLESESPVSD